LKKPKKNQEKKQKEEGQVQTKEKGMKKLDFWKEEESK
jgi:hypothetical protein